MYKNAKRFKGGLTMIRSNLSVILAENDLKITKVAHDTGISRTTLTALSQNDCKGVQFDTLNTLCTYLHIPVSRLIDFIPIDISNINFYHDETYIKNYVAATIDTIPGTLYFDLSKENHLIHSCQFNVEIHIENSDPSPLINERAYTLIVLESMDADTNNSLKVIEELSRTFFLDLSKKLCQNVVEQALSVPEINEKIDSTLYNGRHSFSTLWSVKKFE